MCGRTACTLGHGVLCQASTYRDNNAGGKWRKPQWRDHPPSKTQGPGAYKYYPSTNAPPTRFTPVIVKSEALKEVKKEVKEEAGEEKISREIMPMMFGLIPFYHKGNPKSHGLTTNNCRVEGITESKLYKRCWVKRQFCVILCQGFYEWKTTGVGEAKGAKRQPYFIYAPQKKGYSVVQAEQWRNGTWTEEKGWEGPQLLRMAGLWDVWKDGESGDEIYSYTIITMDSNETFKWLHSRMPAILDTDEKVAQWLEGRGTDEELLNLLKPVTHLQWHKVDPKVGNVRCQDADCMEEMKGGAPPKSSFMANWLNKGAGKSTKEDKKKKAGDAEEENEDVKRIKLEVEENENN